MAHYENFAARFIDYSNEQLFGAFFEFFTYAEKTAMGFWDYHTPPTSGVRSFLPDGVETLPLYRRLWLSAEANFWKVPAVLHYICAFLMRLLLLPITSVIYTVSQTLLIVLNPFTAWANNPRKALYMGIAWAVPAFLAINNHVYNIMPVLRFSTPFTFANFNRVANIFGVPDGLWGMGSALTGGLIVSIFLSIGMACVLYLAKGLGKQGNAVKFEDPRQSNYYDPSNSTEVNGKRTINENNTVRPSAQRDFVWVTAPKHREVPISNLRGKAPVAELNDPANKLNSARANLLYAYYQNKNNNPIIWSTPPRQVKRYLTVLDEIAVANDPEQYKKKATKLFYAYNGIKTSTFVEGPASQHPDVVDKAVREKYRLNISLDSYWGPKK